MRLTKRTFDWTNSEVLALEVLAQICRAEGDLFGFNSIDPTSIRTGRWAIRDGWKVRRVSRTITFEKEILLRTQTVRRVAIELEGIESEREYAGGGRWWHPTRVHYSCGAMKSRYVYTDPSIDDDPFKSTVDWEFLYKVLDDGRLFHLSSGQVVNLPS
ncbi:MAG: hypothetical protein AAB486_04950 [Patescibacteria group bacterium]